MRVLVISAHPDDEVIGAGGTILRHGAAGDELYWCVVTQGHSPQWTEDELSRARQQVDTVEHALGFKRTFRCGFPTVKLNTVPHMELTSAIKAVVDETQPQVIYTTPLSDLNPDHRLVAEASLIAARPLPGSPVRRVLCYENATTQRYGQPPFDPNVFVDITPHLSRKLEIAGLYQTEIREYPHPRSLEGIRLFALERGLSIGVTAAECFMLMREVWS